jgi:hypothetical protein
LEFSELEDDELYSISTWDAASRGTVLEQHHFAHGPTWTFLTSDLGLEEMKAEEFGLGYGVAWNDQFFAGAGWNFGVDELFMYASMDLSFFGDLFGGE